MSIRVVGFKVAVDDAVVDGLVNEKRQPLLGMKLYNFINPKTGATVVVAVWGTNVGKPKWWPTPINRYDQTSE